MDRYNKPFRTDLSIRSRRPNSTLPGIEGMKNYKEKYSQNQTLIHPSPHTSHKNDPINQKSFSVSNNFKLISKEKKK